MALKLSVVIPTYNRAALLVQTLNSALLQTRPPDEIVVVDDGSTDNTREVVAAYGLPVRYHYQTNAYLSAARNTGQRVSTGDAVCFLDSDDLLLPGALARLESALEAAPEAALVYCRCQIINENGVVVDPLYESHAQKGKEYHGDVWRQLLDENHLRSPGAALIRRSHLERTDPFDVALRVDEDWDMFLRLAESAPFALVDEPLFQYRVHSSNMSGNVLNMHVGTLALFQKHLERHRGHPERLRDVAQAYRRVMAEGKHVLARAAFEADSAGEFGKSFGYLFRAALSDPKLFAQRWVIVRLLRTGWKFVRARS